MPKRMWAIGWLFVLAAWIGSSAAGPLTVTVTGTEVSVQYTEPTRNVDGSALTDLAKTNVYYQLPGQPKVKGPDIPATRVSGGGVISTTLIVPVPDQSEADVTFTATATDLSGNESPHSPGVVKRIDRLAPCAPSSAELLCQ